MITIHYARHNYNIENSVQTNIKPFQKYVNSLNKPNNIVLDCINYNNLSSSDISEIAQLFGNYLSSVYTSVLPLFNGEVPLPTDGSNKDFNLSSCIIDLNEIVNLLFKFD